MQFAVIGSGSIGIGWAIVFARAGHQVKVYDIDQSRLDYFKRSLNERLGFLMEEELLDEDATTISAHVTTTLDLADAVRSADYIQECAPELLETKKGLFASLIEFSTPDAIIASSTSALKSSSFTSDLASRERCLVVHPGNPPYLLSVVEVVPAPYTSVDVVARTQEILRELQLNPILVKKEIEGFVFNRLQGAMLREAYALVKDGVIEPKDIDMVVTQGLAKRWSIIGPFGTSALNVEGGIKAHAARMGESYYRMGIERGQGERWSDELVEIVAQSIEKIFHNEDWAKNVNKRDRALMKLTRVMRDNDVFNFYP